MNKKYLIEVRRYARPGGRWGGRWGGFLIVDRIRRVLRAESIGNFNPVFCRYKNNPRVLVHSDAGDMSDPFRRDMERDNCPRCEGTGWAIDFKKIHERRRGK